MNPYETYDLIFLGPHTPICIGIPRSLIITSFMLYSSSMVLMEYSWPFILLPLTLLFSAAVAFLFSAVSPRRRLPPGPAGLPFIGNHSLLGKTMGAVGPTFRRLREAYGPYITLHIGGRPFIFISDHASAHRALVAAGATFADRPTFSVPRYTGIFSASHGSAWRLLRRNVTSEVLHPIRYKSYTDARAWTLGNLLGKLAVESEAAGYVRVRQSFQYTLFSQFMLMCFGEKMEEERLREVRRAHREVLMRVVQFNVFSFLPRFAEFLYWKRWNENQAMRRRQVEVFLPLIRDRMEKLQKNKAVEGRGCSYVDSLLRLEIPEEGGRKLTEREMVVLCSEFVGSGTDTTSTTLEWAMANLVKHPEIQRKLAEEIESVVMDKGGDRSLEYIGEEDLQKMKYLRAVVMETLRRHSPTYFGVPHAVVEEVEMDGYVIPKNASVNFAVAEMGLDEKVWKEPMEFRPERFLEEEVDITGTKEIKMMPFGAGRRICPGMGLAMLHLEWFVANLVWKCEWKKKDGEEVDLADDADEFTVCMKKPLEAVIVPRKMVMQM